ERLGKLACRRQMDEPVREIDRCAVKPSVALHARGLLRGQDLVGDTGAPTHLTSPRCARGGTGPDPPGIVRATLISLSRERVKQIAQKIAATKSNGSIVTPSQRGFAEASTAAPSRS